MTIRTSQAVFISSVIVLIAYVYYMVDIISFIADLPLFNRMAANITATIVMVLFVCVIEYYAASTKFLKNKRVLTVFDGAWLFVAAVGIIITSAKAESDFNYKAAVKQTMQSSQFAMRSSILADRNYQKVRASLCGLSVPNPLNAEFCSTLATFDRKITNLLPLDDRELAALKEKAPKPTDEEVSLLLKSLGNASEADTHFSELLSSTMHPTYDPVMIAWWFAVIIILGLRFTKTLNDFHTANKTDSSENKAAGVSGYGIPGCMMCKSCLLRTYC